ncbi:MAG: CIA30 family protein [Pseudomonadota bacterium]
MNAYGAIVSFICSCSALLGFTPMNAKAGERMLDDFEAKSAARWSYVADTVMGGVSDGQATIQRDSDAAFVRLTGTVSTENNGGFVQVRRQVTGGLPAETEALRLRVRGNGETYYVFLRSTFGTRPWHSYRASFVAEPSWRWVDLSIPTFKPSRGELPASIRPEDVTGIGLVAYGADFEADLSISAIELR